MSPYNWGVLVQQARLVRGITQEGLGQLTGTSRRWISKVETGRVRLPTAKTVRLICRALGLPELEVWKLVAGTTPAEDGLSTDERLFLWSFPHFPEATRRIFTQMGLALAREVRGCEHAEFVPTCWSCLVEGAKVLRNGHSRGLSMNILKRRIHGISDSDCELLIHLTRRARPLLPEEVGIASSNGKDS